MAAGLVLSMLRSGPAGLLTGLAGIGVGIAVFIIPYILGGMGAGDAKLMGAIGAILGPGEVFSAFLFTALAGGVYAIIMIVARGDFKATCARYWTMAGSFVLSRRLAYLPPSEDEQRPRLRYGIAIAAGTLCSVLWGEEVLFAGINGSFL